MGEDGEGEDEEEEEDWEQTSEDLTCQTDRGKTKWLTEYIFNHAHNLLIDIGSLTLKKRH